VTLDVVPPVVSELSLVGRLAQRWRSSLQLRVAATTFLLSGVVVALLGLYLQQRLTDGLLSAKVTAALTELDAGVTKADATLGSAYASDPAETETIVDSLFEDLKRATPTGLYDVALITTSSTENGRISGEISDTSIPARLTASVGEGNKAYAYAPLRYLDGHTVEGLIAGGPVISTGVGPYQLYYFFPLDQEEATIALVRRVLLTVGAMLVVLVVGVAALVTHQVVTPVRQAARSAQRFATGLLEERMRVRGSDELAQLATSFNAMAASLQSHLQRLESLSRLQRRFVADVSHELRTPLTTVRMAADMLHQSRSQFDPEVARSAELLQTQLNRFELLLADLLEISRHDAGAVELDTEPVELQQLVRQVVDDVRVLAERRACDVVLDLPGDPVVVDADARRLGRVLRNLLGNALEHGAGQPVEVSLRAGDGCAAVSVRDRGPGLRPGEAGLVFNRFWRADPARSRHTGGTGLGLSIALEDTRLHGGWLQAWGEPGRGAVFRMTVPLRVGASFAASPLPLDPTETESTQTAPAAPQPRDPVAAVLPGQPGMPQ
jgi:two-component system sensor histidine kinase MtrB